MLTIYNTHIRPLLEFGSTVWNTGYVGDLKLVKSVQRRWTKQVDGFQDLSYYDRLKLLNQYSVQGKLLRADLIKCWKIFHNQSAIIPSDLFTLSPTTNTRGTGTKCLSHIPYWTVGADSLVLGSSINGTPFQIVL